MRPEPGPGPGSRRIRSRSRAAHRATSGFALIAALALLVVLAGTGAVMLRMTGVQQAGTTVAILGLRADWAARSGVEWLLHEGVRLGGCPAASTTLALTEGALAGFQVVVGCSESTHTEGADEYSVLVIRSEARFGAAGGRDYVYRQIQASVVL